MGFFIPNYCREDNKMVKKSVKKAAPKLIECITVRRIGLVDGMSGIGDTVKLDKATAKKLQDAGAVKVKL